MITIYNRIKIQLSYNIRGMTNLLNSPLHYSCSEIVSRILLAICEV
jgi:hypothetical protein